MPNLIDSQRVFCQANAVFAGAAAPLASAPQQPNEPNSPNSPGADQDAQHGLAVEESRPELKEPPLYKVFLLNDDYTPMEFVVSVLQYFFAMNHENAHRVMMHVHTRGKGICGTFTREIAETKVMQVNEFARSHQHPLKCAMEEA